MAYISNRVMNTSFLTPPETKGSIIAVLGNFAEVLPHPGILGPVIDHLERPIPGWLYYFSLTPGTTVLKIYKNVNFIAGNMPLTAIQPPESLFLYLEPLNQFLFITRWGLDMSIWGHNLYLEKGTKVKVNNFVVQKDGDKYDLAMNWTIDKKTEIWIILSPMVFSIYFQLVLVHLNTG